MNINLKIKRHLFILMLLALFFSTTLSAEFYNMTSNNSDAEESLSSGKMSMGSSDLEMAYDKNLQIVGLRFNNVNIPVGATILNAKIRFRADKDDNGNANLFITGELSNDAKQFSKNKHDISSRKKTSAVVKWNPHKWVNNKYYETADISSIIQEIVNQHNFYGDNIVIVIGPNQGCNSCRRRADSRDESKTNAARLEITYTLTPRILIQKSHILEEGDTNERTYKIPVKINKTPSTSIFVDFNTTDGSATVANNDYNSSSGTLEFNSTVLTQYIPITIQGDTINEGAEKFDVNLSNIRGPANFINNSSTIIIANDDEPRNFCKSNKLPNGFHTVNPFNDINKTIEIFCYKNKDYIALPNKNKFNNFVFNKNSLDSTDYYQEATDHSKTFNAIEINAYTMEVISDSSIKTPQNISNFKVMGSSFSNINLIGTPFAIDWDKSTVANCDLSKIRKGYYGQAVKINTLDYAKKAICNISNIKLKLLDDYRYLEYKNKEVLEPSCKLMAESVPSDWLKGEDIKGHYWIKPNKNGRTHSNTDITKAGERPLVAYCWYQSDLDWAWTFLLDLDGKRTINKSDLTNRRDSCSQLGLFPFVPNKEDTFERVRKFLLDNEAEWSQYTGTIQEKVNALYGNSYYLGREQNSLIWPYGSFGVYFPTNGDKPQKWGKDTGTPGWMSGSPMHNIPDIVSDYSRINNDGGNSDRDYYSYGNYSSTDTNTTNNSAYKYKDTMGYKGWVSILGSADLNKTDKWFISRTGAGDNVHQKGVYPYYEPNGNYVKGAWLNFLFDTQGRVRHNDDWLDKYPYYDYMCMSADNYDFTTRYGLIDGPFKVIEHNVPKGSELDNTKLKTKIVNDSLKFDVILLTKDLSKIEPNKKISAGVFLETTKMIGLSEVPKDIHYFGEINDFDLSTGRFEIPASAWPNRTNKLNKANKRLFFKFKYCSRDDLNWTDCWNNGLNGKALTPHASQADSNDFALRPDKFNFNITGTAPYKAGKDYSATFTALDKAGNPAQDYNENLPIDYNGTKSGCLKGIYTPTLSTILFNNGSITKNLKYSEVGSVNIKMKETLGSEFAKVDKMDTQDSQRFISPYDQNWTYSPDHFNIKTKLTQGANNFTYLSSDLNMSVKLDINITAKNKDNNTTKNYSSECYSKPTNYNISYSNITVKPADSITKILYTETTTGDRNSTSINNDVNISAIPNTIFTDGNATIQVLLNFDRNKTKVVEPFVITIKDLNITDTDNVSGGKNIDKNVTFYYGRVHGDDQTIIGKTDFVDVYYEIYCKDCNKTKMNITGDEGAYSADWFRNTLHVNSDGNVSRYRSISDVKFGSETYTDANDTQDNVANIINGLEHVRLVARKIPYKDKIDMNSNTWLISDPTDFIVDFIANGQWAGKGKLGATVDLNISNSKNRRLDW